MKIITNDILYLETEFHRNPSDEVKVKLSENRNKQIKLRGEDGRLHIT